MSKHAKDSNGSFHPLSAPDFLPLPQLRDLQLQRLKAVVQHAYHCVGLFRKRMDERGLTPQDVQTLDDIAKLPFAQKTDLRDTYPFGLFASPMKDIVRLHASSGTTGKPKALFFSRQDVDNAAELCARSMVATGVTRQDIFQNMMTYGLFTGAFVMHYGAEKLGCLVIPAGPGNTERQLMLMQDFHTTTIHITPSFALYFADVLEKRGMDPRKELSLKRAFVGAEPYTEETRRKIEAGLGLSVFNSYGLSEMNGPGVAFECQEQAGMGGPPAPSQGQAEQGQREQRQGGGVQGQQRQRGLGKARRGQAAHLHQALKFGQQEARTLA